MTANPAHALWDARLNATAIPREFDGKPATEDAGYRIQSDMIDYSGLPVAGWKIGATTEPLLGVLGVDRPFLGPVFDKFTWRSGDTIPFQDGYRIETEMTLRMKSDLPFRTEPYGREECEAAIGSIFTSFEIIRFRFEGEGAGASYRAVADGGVNAGLVLGPETTDWSGLDLMNHPVSLSINGEHVVTGAPNELMWDHIFDAAGWTACHSFMEGRGLRAGDYLMTGTCTGMRPLVRGDSVVADFGSMGKISAAFP
jgi:2-keto-4-pentenoate hydratase